MLCNSWKKHVGTVVMMMMCMISTSSMAFAQETADQNAQLCDFNGTKVTHLGVYLYGSRRVRGSIYGRCLDGQVTCFLDEGISDVKKGQEKSIECEEALNNTRRLGVIVPKKERTWPQGVACYQFDTAFAQNQSHVDLFHQAFNEYATKTSISFIDIATCKTEYGSDTQVCGGCQQFFVIEDKKEEDSCHSVVGYAPNQEMILNVGPKCAAIDTYLHELGHAIGLNHEHIHPNRQVIILPDQITFSATEYIKDEDDALTPYNPQSIMHYNDGSMCIPKNLKIQFCDADPSTYTKGCRIPTKADCDTSLDKSFGTSKELTPGDILAIEKLYQAKDDTELNDANYLNSDLKATPTQEVTPAPTTTKPKSTPKPTETPKSTSAPTLKPTQEPDGPSTPMMTPKPCTPGPSTTESPSTPKVTPAPTKPTTLSPVPSFGTDTKDKCNVVTDK